MKETGNAEIAGRLKKEINSVKYIVKRWWLLEKIEELEK
jgi:hypothetical protein